VAVIDFDDAFLAQVEALAQGLRARGWRMAAAESCTGGLVAASCTALAGSSDWFEAGWVTYSNEAKTASLGVRAQTLAAHGAVSAEVVEAMARGAIARSGAQLAVAISGIAGPGGGSPVKPVGTVWVALAWAEPGAEAGGPSNDEIEDVPHEPAVACACECLQLDGDRHAVRVQTLTHAIAWLAQAAARGHGRRH
jgi:nicotinamide-nucleotide amidase